MKLAILSILSVISFITLTAGAAPFEPCFDHGNSGAEPSGAPRHYEIVPPSRTFAFPSLKPVNSNKIAKQNVFRLIIEDVRFTSYKCWDQNKNLTGFDIEMMTQAAYGAGYKYIEFVLRTWASSEIGGVKYPSLLIDLNNGVGDAVSAGMSMTPERESIVHMVGPIYKAGKKLMARNDNPKISASQLEQMMKAPAEGYEAFRGLSIMVQGSTIRSEFFRKLAEANPGLIAFAQLNQKGDGFLHIANEEAFFVVWETDATTIEKFIDARLTTKIFGKKFDLVMLDTGSTKDLLDEGKLGIDTSIVTGNLSADPQFGYVFGKGDGVSFPQNSMLIYPFTASLSEMIRSGRIDGLVTKWFADENAADHSWAF